MDIINILINLAENRDNYKEVESSEMYNKEEKYQSVRTIETKVINCVQGVALKTIGRLLGKDEKLYPLFKQTIEKLTNNTNPVLLYACLYAIRPIYYIDKEWFISNVFKLMVQDIRMCGFGHCRSLFIDQYEQYPELINNLVLKCFEEKDDEDLLSVGAYVLVDLYMRYSVFDNIVKDDYVYNEKQNEKLVRMLICYFGLPNYNGKAKEALLCHIDNYPKMGDPWTRFYDKYIDVDRDAKFIEKLLVSKKSRRILHAFVMYLESANVALVKISNLIFSVCNNLFENIDQYDAVVWDVQNEIYKIVIRLYDETSNRKTENEKIIAKKCLDMWDFMYKKNIGTAKIMTAKLIDI